MNINELINLSLYTSITLSGLLIAFLALILNLIAIGEKEHYSGNVMKIYRYTTILLFVALVISILNWSHCLLGPLIGIAVTPITIIIALSLIQFLILIAAILLVFFAR